MNIDFVKMHALGNDFVVINNTQNIIDCTSELIKKLSDRHRGVGFDQLIILDTADYVNNKFGYRIYNSDGMEVYQCGNGARCIAKYLLDSSLSVGHELTLVTKHASYQVSIELGNITVNMGQPVLSALDIPYKSEQKTTAPHLAEEIDGVMFGVCSLGNPHAVIIVDDIHDYDVQNIGSKLTNHHQFPEGVNIGFMQIISPSEVNLRVYERGVGETLACGSGACAAVVIGRLNKLLSKKVKVNLPGGELKIHWDNESDGVIMIGGATTVFEGSLLKDYIKSS